MNHITETLYLSLTKSGIDVEKGVEFLTKFKLKGSIDQSEIVGIISLGIFGAFVGTVGATTLGNREERGENVTGTKIFCYGIIPGAFIAAGIFDALQD